MDTYLQEMATIIWEKTSQDSLSNKSREICKEVVLLLSLCVNKPREDCEEGEEESTSELVTPLAIVFCCFFRWELIPTQYLHAMYLSIQTLALASFAPGLSLSLLSL